MADNPLHLFSQGHLTEAIAAVTEQVKRTPTDVDPRWLLVELLCFAGELERADKQLDLIGHQDTKMAVAVSLFRQLLRAEQARQKFFSEGAVPDFVEPPSPRIRLILEASICLREKKDEEAAKLLADAEAQRGALAGFCDGHPFDTLRDLDDLTATIFEVLSTQGKYYWVPMERVEKLAFVKRESGTRSPRDLLWRRALVTIRNGPETEVFLPALYAGSHAEQDGKLRLGQATDWRGVKGTPIRGVGQRMLLVGSDAVPFLEIQQLAIEPKAS